MMKMYAAWYIMFLCCTASFFMNAKIKYTGREEVVIDGGFESKNAFINYVVIAGQRYILKQKKDISKIVSAVMRDALAAYIAKDLAIANLVKIISPYDHITGKKYPDCSATLHTIAPGRCVRELVDSKYFQLSLQQISFSKWNDTWLDDILVQMVWHKQLPIIIALDLFICNTDRHRGNIFYDELTDSFYAIDMDNIYRENTPDFVCACLDRMIHVDKRKFSRKEISSLVTLKNTLEFLLKKYPARKIMQRLYKCARKAGFVNIHSYHDVHIGRKIARQITRHEEIIMQSHKSLYKLVKMLDEVITNHQKTIEI
ncbi:MAG TPA: hypothetical protein VKU36_00095 [Candidatus Babeliales bacterium]|nr:hypothetical protein [Candidatus Babeliales bacterium]